MPCIGESGRHADGYAQINVGSGSGSISSMISGVSFFGEPTFLPIGHIVIDSEGNGFIRSKGRAQATASAHNLHGCRMTGILSWIADIISFAGQVMTAKVRISTSAGSRHVSQMPASAKGAPDFMATA